MARQSNPNRRPTAQSSAAPRGQQANPSAATPKGQQSRVRKVFTIIICVVVALGLMLPVTGLGVASCSQMVNTTQGAPNGS